VTQELGCKSANIILPDADLGRAIPAGVLRCLNGVYSSQRDAALAKQTAEGVKNRRPA
jgi:hypothetical protein